MYFKIMIEHDKDERMEKLASEIQRQIAKVYGVRLVEMTNYVTRPPES